MWRDIHECFLRKLPQGETFNKLIILDNYKINPCCMASHGIPTQCTFMVSVLQRLEAERTEKKADSGSRIGSWE